MLAKSIRCSIVVVALFSQLTQTAVAAPEGHVIDESQSNKRILYSKFRNAVESTVRDGINRIPSQNQLPQALVDGNVELTILVISRMPLGSFGF